MERERDDDHDDIDGDEEDIDDVDDSGLLKVRRRRERVR